VATTTTRRPGSSSTTTCWTWATWAMCTSRPLAAMRACTWMPRWRSLPKATASRSCASCPAPPRRPPTRPPGPLASSATAGRRSSSTW